MPNDIHQKQLFVFSYEGAPFADHEMLDQKALLSYRPVHSGITVLDVIRVLG